MDRIALSKRIGGLADVFASNSPIRRELEAMSYALEHMQDEKFATILNEGYEADDKESVDYGFQTGVAKPGAGVMERVQERRQNLPGKPAMPVFEPKDPKAALEKLLSDPQVAEIVKKNPQLSQAMKEAGIGLEVNLEQPSGNAWSREASEAVIRNLVSDVLGREAMQKTVCCDTGRQLDKKQMPDATKKQEKPATLTDPQTPHLNEALDSGMYEKSKGAVRKEAAADAPVTEEEAPATDAPATDEPSVAQQQSEEKAEKKVEKTQEKATETAEDTAKALKKLDKMTAKKASEEPVGMIMFEGIELSAPMDEVELTADDVKTLGKLFQ